MAIYTKKTLRQAAMDAIELQIVANKSRKDPLGDLQKKAYEATLKRFNRKANPWVIIEMLDEMEGKK